MKFEALSILDLLRKHLQREYQDTVVLVIWDPCCGSQAEFESLKDELEKIGVTVPYAKIGIPEVLVFEVPAPLAIQFVNDHDKASIQMEVWHGGNCLHENH